MDPLTATTMTAWAHATEAVAKLWLAIHQSIPPEHHARHFERFLKHLDKVDEFWDELRKTLKPSA